MTVKVSDFPGLATVGIVVDIGHERAAVRTSVDVSRIVENLHARAV